MTKLFRTFLVLVVMILMSTGCASQEIPEAEKEKPRQEVTHKEETGQEALGENNENKTPSTSNTEVKDLVPAKKNDVVKGKITLQGTDPGLGLLIEEITRIGPYEVKQLIFNREENVLKYIPRSALTYYFEGDLSLREELSGQLDLKIKVDPDTIYYEEDRDLAWVNVLEVLSLNGEANPRDKSGDTYPDQYYKDVIHHLSASMDIPIKENIQETKIYMAGGVFTEAVDELLSRGYAITMGEDRYHIIKE